MLLVLNHLAPSVSKIGSIAMKEMERLSIIEVYANGEITLSVAAFSFRSACEG